MSDAQKTCHHFVNNFDTYKHFCFPESAPDFLLTFPAEGLTQEGSLSICSIREADWEGGPRQTPQQNREEIAYVGIAKKHCYHASYM